MESNIRSVSKPMRTKLFTFLYNEEFLLPFLLSHYRWVDHFHAFVGMDSTDRTVPLLEQAARDAAADYTHVPRRITMENLTMPGGFDDGLKIERLNERIGAPTRDFDWYCVIDSDEFCWPQGDPACLTVHQALQAVPAEATMITSLMFQVYRHVTDKDLDPAQHPVVLQRRHGNPGVGCPYGKPNWIRPNLGITYGVGCHHFASGPIREAAVRWSGAHWQNADPEWATVRRLRDRRDRLSENNRRHGYGIHCTRLGDNSVRELCKENENEPECF